MYLLDPKTMRVRLRKDAEQFSLFGGDPTPVALTPKGRRAKKQREKWGTQTELFPSNQFSVPTLKPKPPKAAKPSLTPKAPKAPLQPKAPKAPGAGGRKKIPEGTTRIKDGRQEILKNSRWRPVAPKDQPTPGLAVLRDEPATVAPVAAPAKPEPTPVSTPEPAIAPTPTVEPTPTAPAGPSLEAIERIVAESLKGVFKVEHTPDPKQVKYIADDIKRSIDLHGLDHVADAKHKLISTISNLSRKAANYTTPDGDLRSSGHWYTNAQADHALQRIFAELESSFGSPTPGTDKGIEDIEAIHNILYKPGLSSADAEKVEAIAGSLLQTLRSKGLFADAWWRDKESTKDAVRQSIRDFLYDENTGLPVDGYTEDEVIERADRVFIHVFRSQRPADRPSRSTTPPTPAEPPAPSLESDADFASTKRQEERIAVNQAVRDLLAQKPDGPYSQDELTLLAKYSGKGGITQDEGSLSEYYTRPDVAKFTTNLLYQNGYQGGVVLEPSCGNGVFLHQLKSDPNTLAVGVELDSTSGQAAAALNPHADVNHGVPFERFLLDNPNITPDAIVGNVPFGTRTVEDLEAFRKVGKGWKDNGDFFVHESLSRLKPGGTMALIVPHGITTGKNHQKLRRELMKQGRVVGAYRLPNTAFAHTGTQTITDILVIQKHPDAVLNAIAQKDQGVIASTRDDAFIHGKYFEENPEHILGTVRAITNQYGGESFTVDGSVEDALAKAPPLAPKVTYDGLNLPTQDEDGPQQGDEKYIGGRLYRFEGHPGRWHLVPTGDGVEAEEGADPSAYGTGSMAEAEAILKDPGQRVMIDPENLRAMAQLAGSTLTPAEAAAVKDASMAVDQMGSTVDKAKLAHAMLLAGHLQRLQKMGTDDPIHLEQALAMLQAYREAHGNPATDRSLSALAKQLPALLHLQGAFDEEGTVSDYFANHEAVMEQAKRSHSEAGAAMGEAFRAAGGEAVTLGEIRQHLEVSMTDDDLAAALAADPTVGYMGGGYMPLERLLVGNGFNLMDALLMEADTLPEGSPLRRKLEEQVGMIRARLQPRAMEDITTPFWAVGSWIPVDALNAFLEANDYHLRVGYNPLASKWQAIREGDDHVFASDGSVYGLKGDILSSMNRERLSHGSKTKEAKEAIAALEQRFGQWLSGSDYRLQVEEAYNVAFNGDLPQEFSGEPLDIPLFEQHGGDPENGVRAKRLHDYQNSTIRQMAEQGRGIIALGVGLGKTATSIGLALHLKGLGRAKKPTFVVPKSVLANWVREIDFWAPGANVMILGQTQQFWANGEPAWEVPGHKVKTKGGNPATDANGNYLLTREDGVEVSMAPAEVQKRSNLAFKDDDAATKKRKMRQLAQNSYDIVLMSEPVFQTIKLSTDVEQRYLDDITQAGVGHINPDAKATHKKLEQIEKRRTKLADRTGETEDTITFEELGIDALFHDEAHHLKNLYGTQRSGDVAFLSQAESDRSLDFYYKARYIREQNNNQNCYLLTATPTTNNPLEAFNMLQHVCPEEFEARGIQNIDDFLGMFGKIESVTVPGVDLEMTEKNGLVGFKNLKDLRHLFNKYTRMQSAKDVGLPIPEELTQDHYVDMTDAQKEVYADLKVRAQKVQEDENDHIFSIISDMDKAAIDLSYYNHAGSGRSQMGQMAKGEKSPKIEECANQVMSSRAGNGGKQIVFCDAVQLHEDLKRQLVEAGYPEDEIAIVNAGTVPKSSDRQKISQAYNSGRISLVIGNTATMGEGMNFQIGTTDIHHLTTPWTPAAIEQRNGRGVRQGNELDGVNCHYYHAKGSFDGYRKGVVERKRGWIDDLWRGDADEATNQNTGALSMDDIELMMADDPEAARAKLEANKEVQMARHSAKMTGQAMKQFGQLQTMKLALSKMAPDQRNSERGRALADRIRATADALGRNQYFPHKDLLDGATPAYVGTDGTVLKVGDHVQKANGAVYRIESIDPASGRMSGTNVSGRDGAPTLLEKDPLEVKFNRINNHKAHDGVKPIAFDTAAHAERVIDSISTYSEVARLDAHSLNANRDRILEKLRGPGYHKRVPYLDPSTNLVEEGNVDDMPPGAQVMWPHDGDALEHVLRTMTDPRKERDSWRYQTIAATLAGGSSWHGVAADLKPRIDAYREQHRAMTEQGPKEGDTRINQAGNQEVFRSGRWHRVGEDAPASTGASSRVSESVLDAPTLPLNAPAPEPTTVSTSEPTGASPSPTAKGLKARNLIGPLPGEGEDLTPDPGDSDWAASNKRQTQSLRDSAIKNREMVDRLMANPDVAKVLNRHLKAGGISVNSSGDVGMSATRRDSLERAIRNAEPGLMRGFDSTLADMIALKGVYNKEQPPAPAPDPAQAIADGMMALYRADEDGATERNGLGFDKLHSPYERDPDTGERRVKNQFVASMIERIEAGEGLTPNQIAACANVLTKYRNQLKDHHGVILPSTEDLKAYTDEITAEKKPERAAPTVSREGWTRQDWAKEIVAALKEDAMAHGFEPNVWDKKGSMRIYLNTDGPRTGPGFIDVHPDGTISNETTLPDNHPALEIALNASKGFKQREQVALSGDKPPGREAFARYLEQEINNYAAGDVKAAVWTGGRHVRVYLNDPTKDRKSGGLGFIDVGMTGITTGGGLKSNSPLYQLATDITNSVVNHHGRLEKAARRYTLAGVAYELCRTADRVFLKKVAHAF